MYNSLDRSREHVMDEWWGSYDFIRYDFISLNAWTHPRMVLLLVLNINVTPAHEIRQNSAKKVTSKTGKEKSTIKFSIFSFPRNSTLWYIFYLCADFYAIKIHISIRKRDFKITSFSYSLSFHFVSRAVSIVAFTEKRNAACDWLVSLLTLIG